MDNILPTGIVTFLFTDIEGSTMLWETHPGAMRTALANHDEILRRSIEQFGGHVFKTVGDAFCAAFSTPSAALRAALEAQLALSTVSWGDIGEIRVRMALHAGEAEERDNDFFGPVLNRTARLVGAAYGRQILLSQIIADMTPGSLPPDTGISDLGVHRLKDLTSPEHVWQVIHPGLPSEFPKLRTLDFLPTNLPQQLTAFIGREKEIADIRNLLKSASLLTLTGSGGTGKTRLALQISADVIEDYADGVWLTELAGIADPAMVPQAVADALSIREAAGEPIIKTLVSAMRTRRILLLLDNCEHLLDSCAQLVAALLNSCPHVRILASSRETLGISGEQSYRVPSMSLPDSSERQTSAEIVRHEAVQLFINRARLVQPDFEYSGNNCQEIASICRRLDGIPLAIELAAARARSMSVQDINGRLDQRFRLLTGGSRSALPRQQTLRSLIDWSYDLLNEQEKALLNRLSVFSGGCTAESVEAICSGEPLEEFEVLNLLTSLADKSLLVVDIAGPATRYRLLETVRQYARDRLLETAEVEQWRDRHLAYFKKLAEEAESHNASGDQAVWLQRLETEHDNLRVALSWSIEMRDRSENGLRMAAALRQFWMTRGHYGEGRQVFSSLLAAVEGEVDLLVLSNAFTGEGILAAYQGDFEIAASKFQHALDICRKLGDHKGICAALIGRGNVANILGDNVQAQECFEESLALYRETGDKRGIYNSLGSLARLAGGRGDTATARAMYKESLALSLETGDKRSVAIYYMELGSLEMAEGEYSAARALYNEGLEIVRELGDRQGISNTLVCLGLLCSLEGDPHSAQEHFADALDIERLLGNRAAVANTLGNLGSALFRAGDLAAARARSEESLAISREIGDRLNIAAALLYLGNVVGFEGELTAARAMYEEALAVFEALGNPRGISAAYKGLGDMLVADGNVAQAMELYKKCLTMQNELRDRLGISEVLESLAVCYASIQDCVLAARLWGAAENVRINSNSPRLEVTQARYQRQVSEAAETMGDQASFEREWQAGYHLKLDEAVTLALHGRNHQGS